MKLLKKGKVDDIDWDDALKAFLVVISFDDGDGCHLFLKEKPNLKIGDAVVVEVMKP